MISVCHVLLNKFAIDITRLLLYCVGVTALRFKVIFFPFYEQVEVFNIYMIY